LCAGRFGKEAFVISNRRGLRSPRGAGVLVGSAVCHPGRKDLMAFAAYLILHTEHKIFCAEIVRGSDCRPRYRLTQCSSAWIFDATK
jgi:hypothetical protein